MRNVYEARVAEAREIEGQLMSGRDKIVPPTLFGDVCRLIWPKPKKPAAELAKIGKVDERTAKRWLSTEYDPPWEVALVVVNKIFERRGIGGNEHRPSQAISSLDPQGRKRPFG